MKTVLVTGGIASGKSVVCGYLASKGFPVYDSDSRTKALYESVDGLKERVEKALGLPFSQIGIIFTDAAKRKAVEDAVYPEVIRDFERWRADQKAEIVFLESAVACEKRALDGLYDEVLLIRAPLESRLERNPKTAERIGAQDSGQINADWIIDNDSDIPSLHLKIEQYLKTQL